MMRSLPLLGSCSCSAGGHIFLMTFLSNWIGCAKRPWCFSIFRLLTINLWGQGHFLTQLLFLSALLSFLIISDLIPAPPASVLGATETLGRPPRRRSDQILGPGVGQIRQLTGVQAFSKCSLALRAFSRLNP